MPTDIVAALTKASAGLLYPSEKDAPFQAFLWDDLKKVSAAAVLAKTGQAAQTLVAETKPGAFFKPLITDQDWHGRPEKTQVKKFQNLQQTLAKLLTGLRIFKIGQTRKTVVLVGKTAEGAFAGLVTEALET